RALARSPEVLLLDEPFGALDALTRLRMQDLLLEIHAAEPTTVLVVTHDVEEALYLADRAVQLRPRRDAAPGAPPPARPAAAPGVHSPRPTTSEDHSCPAASPAAPSPPSASRPPPRSAPPPACPGRAPGTPPAPTVRGSGAPTRSPSTGRPTTRSAWCCATRS